ncbi:MAG: gliding motility-associated ABC transporter ATP-binding subunit GldA [Chitinophagia bacterium]|nr:gliding motility-associated ABC transporter ATP-binding subunit GldA [Chitinophagia bacterium]
MSIKVSNLLKVYGTQKAVDNISFELRKGEIVGFLGPNGAGKSTTMKIITGYLPATSGTAEVCGINVQDNKLEVSKRLGYLPEANPLYQDMYVREYLNFSAGIHNSPKSRVEEMIALTDLGREAHKKIAALSKGYKQRVGLAQAMLHDPEVLILDEPTSGLDPNQILEIRDLIRTIGQQKTVLLSTHIMQEVQAMCSRAIIINRGQIVADDSIEHLKEVNTRKDMLVVSFAEPVSDQLLRQLKAVTQTEAIGNNTYNLTTNDLEALKKEILQWALTHNVNIASIQTKTSSLEDVFRDLTKPGK